MKGNLFEWECLENGVSERIYRKENFEKWERDNYVDGIFVVVKHMILVALIGELILYLNPSVIYEKFLRILLELILFLMFLGAISNWKSTEGNTISYNLLVLQEQMEEKMRQMDSTILQRQEKLADSLLDNMLGIQGNMILQENSSVQDDFAAEENPEEQGNFQTEEYSEEQDDFAAGENPAE